MDSKPFYQSKTLWFNLLAVLVALANLAGYADFVPDAGWMAMVMAVANFLLRFVTSQPVSSGKSE